MISIYTFLFVILGIFLLYLLKTHNFYIFINYTKLYINYLYKMIFYMITLTQWCMDNIIYIYIIYFEMDFFNVAQAGLEIKILPQPT
jgi:hypothetical protein